MSRAPFDNRARSPYYGALQDVIDSIFGPATDVSHLPAEVTRQLGPEVRRLDVIIAAESADLPDDLREIVNLLPPGNYTRQRLCDQLNSSIGGHAWGQVYGTVE